MLGWRTPTTWDWLFSSEPLTWHPTIQSKPSICSSKWRSWIRFESKQILWRFFHRTQKAPSIQCLLYIRVRAKLKIVNSSLQGRVSRIINGWETNVSIWQIYLVWFYSSLQAIMSISQWWVVIFNQLSHSLSNLFIHDQLCETKSQYSSLWPSVNNIWGNYTNTQFVDCYSCLFFFSVWDVS